jgi:hypothetical protein
MTNTKSLIERAFELTPDCMLNIQRFDAVEIRTAAFHPDYPEPGCPGHIECEPGEAEFWIVCLHSRAGEISELVNYSSQEAAEQLAAKLRETYPHLAKGGAQ